MRLDERGRTVAVTKHQSKPDGSKVLSHSVTKEPMVAAMRKWEKQRRVTDKPIPEAKPLPHIRRARAKVARGKSAEPTGNKGLARTLGALRRARMKLLTDRGAFAGEGQSERPAPLYSDFAADDFANPAAAGSQTRIFNPAYPNFANRAPYPWEADPNSIV